MQKVSVFIYRLTDPIYYIRAPPTGLLKVWDALAAGGCDRSENPPLNLKRRRSQMSSQIASDAIGGHRRLIPRFFDKTWLKSFKKISDNVTAPLLLGLLLRLFKDSLFSTTTPSQNLSPTDRRHCYWAITSSESATSPSCFGQRTLSLVVDSFCRSATRNMWPSPSGHADR